MTRDIGYEFSVDPSGRVEGFNNSSINHFTGDRLQHLGREVPQNAVDARLGGGPARLSIKLVSVPASSIPDKEGLVTAFERCLAYAKKSQDGKAVEFFRRALDLFASGSIDVLQITDTGTTGLGGPCIPGRPYHAFMKGEGLSKKSGNASGSYGIGKYAPYAVSEMRTVFVSTISTDEADDIVQYVQGKSVLISHLDDTLKTRQGTGFWGVRDGCGPVDGNSPLVPDWLRMTDRAPSSTQRGTMLSILGFEAVEGWREMLAGNIAENFFAAIHDGQLEAEIDKGHRITASTLAAVLEDPRVVEAMKSRPEGRKIQRASGYLRAMSGIGGARTITGEAPHLGTCRLHILVEKGLMRRVGVLRNGMLISEEVRRLTQFNEFDDFAAVVECVSEEGNLLLRDMEPPTHNDFEWDNLVGDRKKAGKAALEGLADWARKEIAKLAKDETYGTSEIEELSAFFGDIEEEGGGGPAEMDPTGKLVIGGKPSKLSVGRNGATTRVFGITAVEHDPEDDEDAHRVEGTRRPGGVDDHDPDHEAPGGDIPDTPPNDTDRQPPDIGKMRGRDTGAQSTAKGMRVGNVRAVVIDGSTRRLGFTPTWTGKAVVEIRSSGADQDPLLPVATSTAGTVRNGRIEVVVEKEKRFLVEAKLDRDFTGAVRIVVNEV